MKSLSKLRLALLICFSIFMRNTYSQVEIILNPGPENGKDAYINTFYDSKTGSTQSFIAAAWTYGGEMGIGRSFIQFNLPELPSNYSNFSAFLNLYYDYSSQHVGHGGENASKLERITQPWSEDELYWYNQPNVDPTEVVILPTSETSDQDYPNIDVTQLVLNMYANPDESFGLRMSLINEELYRSMILASSDHPDESVRPSLVIRYDTCTLPVNGFEYETNYQNCQFYYDDPSVSSWTWDFGNGYGSTLQNPLYYFNEPGNYFVCLQVENDCGLVTICDSVQICEELIPDFDFIIEDFYVTFSNLSQNGNTFFWDFGNGFFSFLENPEFQFSDPGDYNVCLSVANNCDTSTVCKTVSISILNSMNIGDISSDFLESHIKVFPNPAKGEVFVSSVGLETQKIELINYMGSMLDIYNPDFNQSQYRISLHNCNSGFYFLRITTESGILTKKITVLK